MWYFTHISDPDSNDASAKAWHIDANLQTVFLSLVPLNTGHTNLVKPSTPSLISDHTRLAICLHRCFPACLHPSLVSGVTGSGMNQQSMRVISLLFNISFCCLWSHPRGSNPFLLLFSCMDMLTSRLGVITSSLLYRTDVTRLSARASWFIVNRTGWIR